MEPKHETTPWRTNSYDPVRIVADSKTPGLALTLGIAICNRSPSRGGTEAAETDAARIVACVNACAGIDDPAAALKLLRDAPCTCPEWETGTGMVQFHDIEHAGCYRNHVRRILGGAK